MRGFLDNARTLDMILCLLMAYWIFEAVYIFNGDLIQTCPIINSAAVNQNDRDQTIPTVKHGLEPRVFDVTSVVHINSLLP